MRRLVAIAVLLAVGGLPAAHAQRVTVSINDGWRYADGDHAGAEAPGFETAGWQRVALPHTWNADDAFDDAPGYRQGVGWYRRALTVPEAYVGRRLFLRFEGANQVAEVFVNGQAVGTHVGGYTAFAFEITDAARVGANVLAVRVDNRHDDDIPPLNADFTFYGGIYRDAWLVATDAVHVDLLDHAGPGVYLDTPALAEGDATVRLRTRVTNDGAADASVAVRHSLLDADGEDVARVEERVEVAAGQTVEQTQRLPPPSPPRLWTPDAPQLYRVVTEVVDAAGAVRDRVSNPLGFRWVAADGDGFTLNGERLALHGTNRHQDHAGLGNALPDALHRRDVDLVKWTGFNFLRTAHYPQDPAVLEATDAVGLAVWEEIPIVNRITVRDGRASDAFAANSERMLVEMIRQHYNHPSVVMWGYMNEVLLRMPEPAPDGYVEAVVALAERLERVAEREDPYRLTAMAFSNGEVTNGSGLQDVADVFGMNLYFGWYYDDFATLGAFLDSLHAAHPDRPLMISEYGAGTDERVHSPEPRAFDFSVEWGQRFHLESFRQIRARDYLVGSGVWNQFDFGSNHRQDTKDALNQKGLFFFDRTPKDIAYWYRAVLTDEPVLHIERERLRRAEVEASNALRAVQVFTNADSLAWQHDGQLGYGFPRDDARIMLHPALSDGANYLEVTGTWYSERDGGPLERSDAVTLHYTNLEEELDAAGPVIIAGNVGGTYSVTGPSGLVYVADERAFGDDSRAGRTHHRIAGTDLDPLFQAYEERSWEGADAAIPLPPGRYTVTLGFMEPTHDAPGRRVFSVLLDGVPVVADLDLAAEAGRWAAVERAFTFDVVEEREVRIELVPSVGLPVLSSFVIQRH